MNGSDEEFFQQFPSETIGIQQSGLVTQDEILNTYWSLFSGLKDLKKTQKASFLISPYFMTVMQ